MSSSIADLMIRIKNGYMAGRPRIIAQNSRFGRSVLDKLQKLHYIKGYTVEEGNIKDLIIDLNYDEDKNTPFTDVEIISKPGQRMYAGSKTLKRVMSGFGFDILSTPKGILTNIEAKKQNTGGELLFRIW